MLIYVPCASELDLTKGPRPHHGIMGDPHGDFGAPKPGSLLGPYVQLFHRDFPSSPDTCSVFCLPHWGAPFQPAHLPLPLGNSLENWGALAGTRFWALNTHFIPFWRWRLIF